MASVEGRVGEPSKIYPFCSERAVEQADRIE